MPPTSQYPPLIDLGAFEKDHHQEEAIALQLRDACREVGFFYVKSPLVTRAVIDDAFDSVNILFDLPENIKQGVAAQNSPLFRGYQGQKSESHSCTPTTPGDTKDTVVKDLKESYALGALGTDSPMHGDNQWPPVEYFPAEKREQLQAYWDAMLAVSKQVSAALARALGLEIDFFTRNMTNPIAQMVMLRYPPPEQFDAEGRRSLRVGCGAHTDCGFLTLLAQSGEQCDALQIKNNSGEWVDAPQLEGGIVLCNCGDLVERWSNDYFKSTWHRVHATSGKMRHSIPFFCNLDYHAIVDPAESVCKGELRALVGEAKFGRTCAGDYICQKLGLMYGEDGVGDGDAGSEAEAALKAGFSTV